MVIIDCNKTPLIDEIENTLLSSEFNWYFLKDISYPSDSGLTKKTMGFAHNFLHETSSYFYLSEKIFEFAKTTNSRLEETEIKYARSFLQTPLLDAPEHDNIHTDMDEEHLVVLYYVNDSDGDTFMFDENGVVNNRITPKKGRMIMFDGNTLHASSCPKSGARCVINLNLVRKN